jgi:hypothetical protein
LPALDHAITCPLRSVIETMVLLKEARSLTKPVVTFFEPLALRILIAPSSSLRSSSAVGWRATPPTSSTGLAGAATAAASPGGSGGRSGGIGSRGGRLRALGGLLLGGSRALKGAADFADFLLGRG